MRAPEPSELSAANREPELLRLRKRATEESSSDDASIAAKVRPRGAFTTQLADAHTDRNARVHSAWQERPRARGPPVA